MGAAHSAIPKTQIMINPSLQAGDSKPITQPSGFSYERGRADDIFRFYCHPEGMKAL